MDEKIKVLILEDEPVDAELVTRELKKILTNYTLQVSDNKAEFVEALNNYKPDLILSDYSLPQFNGMEAIMLTQKISPLTPVIIVTGSINEETAVECIKAGAKDYVLKENLTRLGPAVFQALEIKALITEQLKVKKELQENEEKYRILFELAHDAIFIADDESGIIIDANKKASKLIGYSKEELIGRHQSFLHPKSELDKISDRFKTVGKLKETIITETSVINKDGSIIPVEISAGEKTIVASINVRIGIFRDISERKQAERLFIKSQERFDLAMKATKDGLYDWNLITNEVYYSPGWKSMLGYEYDELPNEISVWEKLTDPEDMKRVSILNQKLFNKQLSRIEIDFKMKHKSGHWVNILSRSEVIFDENDKAIRMIGTHSDITDRKRAEELLKQRMSELEIFNEAAVDREIAINDHRKEINELLAKAGKEAKYEIIK